MNLNKVMIAGNLTKDPEVRTTPRGTSVADIGIAVNRVYSVENGEKKEETIFVDVTLWGRQAEVAGQYLKKGHPVFIEGRLHMDVWEQDGQKRSRLKVVCENMLLLPRSDAQPKTSRPETSRPLAAAPARAAAVQEPISDRDDLPF